MYQHLGSRARNTARWMVHYLRLMIDGDDAVADETVQSRTFKDEEHCVVDAPPPQNGGGEDDGGGADKSTRSPITHARVILALGVVLEVCATFWAFQQAVSAGALYGEADCAELGLLSRLDASTYVVDNCDGPIDADLLYNYTETLSEQYYFGDLKDYVGCDSLADTPTGARSFAQRCTCPDEFQIPSTCSWVALSSPSDDTCYAQCVYTNSSDGTVTGVFTQFNGDCWSSHQSGSMELTITAVVVALSSELLEAFVGFKYWKDTEQRTYFMPVVSVIEALGVVAVSSVLMSLPGFYSDFEDATNSNITRLPGFLWLAWTAVIVAVVGALTEVTADCSARIAGRLPYLGAVGNGLVWLGAAVLEVTVTSYLLWTGAAVREALVFVREAAVLFALELLALVAMWVARGLWTRAKLLRSVKSLEWPRRKGPTSTPSR